jgi:3-phenylpropionate/cinnamic acid dioxygenase small subunit
MALKDTKGNDMHPTDELIHINKEYIKLANIHDFLFDMQETLDDDDFPAYKTLLNQIEEKMAGMIQQSKEVFKKHQEINK